MANQEERRESVDKALSGIEQFPDFPRLALAVICFALHGTAAFAQDAVCAPRTVFPLSGGGWIDRAGKTAPVPAEDPAQRPCAPEAIKKIDMLDNGPEGLVWRRKGLAALKAGTPDASWNGGIVAYSEGLRPMADTNTGKTGYVDPTGAWIVKPQFVDGYYFRGGLAAVIAETTGTKRIGFIDHGGMLVIPYKFPALGGLYPLFSEGRAAMPAAGTTQAALDRDTARWGYIDARGNWAIPANYDGGAEAFDGGLAHVRLGRQERYIDRDGRTVWPNPHRR